MLRMGRSCVESGVRLLDRWSKEAQKTWKTFVEEENMKVGLSRKDVLCQSK